jgi:phage terminase large subunit
LTTSAKSPRRRVDAYPPFASLPSSPSAIRVLDFLSNYGQPLDFYVDWLEERYPRASTERVDWLPHDASVHELGTGKSRVERLVELRCRIERVPKLSVVDGINATKLELQRMWFNKATTGDGIEALRQYRTAYDEKLKRFADTPHRDWTTDIDDAARYMAIVAREIAPPAKETKPPVGVSMSELSMDQFMDIEDEPERFERV